MKIPQSSYKLDNPSFPLLQAGISYWSASSGDGSAAGLTIVDDRLLYEPTYRGHLVKILTGPAAGQVRKIALHPAPSNAITVGEAFTDSTGAAQQITAGTLYAIISNIISNGILPLDFWSEYLNEIAVAQAANTFALPDVTVAGLPTGAIPVRVIAMFKSRVIYNSNAGGFNKLDGSTVPGVSQVIQVRNDAPGTWRDAINLRDDIFRIAAAVRESGDVFLGQIDISNEVDENDTYNFQWLLAKSDLDNLYFHDIQTGIRVWYR